MGDREIGREGNFNGCTLRRTLASIQYGTHAVYSTQNNTQRGPCHCDFGKLQIQNCKRVYKLCIVMCRNVLFDRWMTCFYVMAIMDWGHGFGA